MNSIPYIFQAQIAFALLWIIYRVAMHRGGGLAHNRAYLLAITAAAFIIPALSIPVYPAAETVAIPVDYYNEIVPYAPVETVEQTDYAALLWWAYAAGAIVLAAVSLWQMNTLLRVIRSSKRESISADGCRICETEKVDTALTFCRYVLINRSRLSPGELPQVVAHERAHARLGHSYDLMFAQAVTIALWWNPFVWLWRRSLKEVHEFQADDYALSQGFPVDGYIDLIIQNLTDTHPEFASGFSYSLIKKRLQMISKSKRGSALRTLYAFPVAIALLAMFSFTQKPADSKKNDGKVKDEKLEEVVVVGYGIAKKEGANIIVDENGDVSFLDGALTDGKVSLEPKRIIVKTTEGDGNPQEVKILVDGKEVKREELSDLNLSAKGVTAVYISSDKQSGEVHVTTRKEGDESAANLINLKIRNAETEGEPKTYVFRADTIEAIRGKMVSVSAAQKEGQPVEQTTHTMTFTRSLDDQKQPLFIIDGKEMPTGSLQKIDPSTIESISVLKDKATDAYGAKGKDGVILITTKRKDASTFSGYAVYVNDKKVADAKAAGIYVNGKQLPVSDGDEPFLVVETMPVFGNGGDLGAFRNWVQGNLKYPAEAAKNNVQGRVTVQFVVEKDGSVGPLTVLNSPSQLLSDETVRVVKSSPKWTPGKQKGKTVRVSYTLPVDFKLQNSPDKPSAAATTAGGDEPFLIAETMPVFGNGGDLGAFRNWVQGNLKYPAEAAKNNVQGRVIVQFVVEKDGSVGPATVISSPSQLLSDEAMRVVKSSPKWAPGKQRGETVRVRYTLPVEFNIIK